MAKGYGRGNTYGGGKPPVGLKSTGYGKKSAVGVTSANFKGTGRRGEKWIADPRGK